MESHINDGVQHRIGISQPESETDYPSGDAIDRLGEGPQQGQYEEWQPADSESSHYDPQSDARFSFSKC